MACVPAWEEAEGMEEQRSLARDEQNISFPLSFFGAFFFWRGEGDWGAALEQLGTLSVSI